VPSIKLRHNSQELTLCIKHNDDDDDDDDNDDDDVTAFDKVD
jgi:hypothetical protein